MEDKKEYQDKKYKEMTESEQSLAVRWIDLLWFLTATLTLRRRSAAKQMFLIATWII